MGGMQVRPALYADLPAIHEIYNEAVLNTTASYDYQPRPMEDRVEWFALHGQQGLPVFVAEEARRIVGWSSLSRFRERIGYRFTVENSVYVAAGERGRGVGRRLMPPLIDAAHALGLRSIIAAIDAGNEASVRLHSHFGFVEVGRLPQVGFKFNRWLDVVYMQRLLD